MRKLLFLAGIAGLLAVTMGGMAAEARKSPSPMGEHFAYGHPGVGNEPERIIHVRALDTLRFQPSRITVLRGTTVKFVITNTGRLAHEFVLGNAAVQAAHAQQMRAMPGMRMPADVNAVSLPPGQTRELVWTFTRVGSVEYACHVPGHFAAGMVGRISIEPSPQW